LRNTGIYFVCSAHLPQARYTPRNSLLLAQGISSYCESLRFITVIASHWTLNCARDIRFMYQQIRVSKIHSNIILQRFTTTKPNARFLLSHALYTLHHDGHGVE
jgi:hypothetical protein